MKKRFAKKVRFTPEYDSQRETRVLLEDMNSKINILAEGHTGIAGRLDNVYRRLDNIEAEVGTVKMAVMDNNHQIRGIEKKFDVIISNYDERLQKLEARQ